jgi:signal recognition particle receptor subunit beta
MVELNHHDRTIKVKIVYYGPPVGGKTTNLQVLHRHAQATRRGELISINSAQDRTILFDLLPLRATGFRGFDLQIQLLAVPGQAMYSATRRLVLKGADAIVFVANSAADRWQENIQSFREMTQNLITFQLDPASLPLVLQFNKRDLPQVTPLDIMERALNARKVESIPAVAIRGEGVLETFAAILMRAMHDLGSRYHILDTVKGQSLAQWTQQTVAGMFGTNSLAATVPPGEIPPAPVPAAGPVRSSVDHWGPPERRTVRVTLPQEVARDAGAGPDARANETLVDSYVQASSQLGTALSEVREERDLARLRLEDIEQALSAAHEVLSGQPLEPTLAVVIGRMAQAGGASHASFLMQGSERSFKAVALKGLAEDPVLRVAAGVRYMLAKFLDESLPRLHQVEDSLDLADALESSNPIFRAVVSVPIRTPRGLQGLAMLYFAPDAVLPRAELLAHLASISQALSSSLELARALETVQAAERSLELALAGTASVRGLNEVVSFLVELRDRLGAMRKRPDAPFFFLEEFARLAPSLSGALTTARSLLAFSGGEIQREAVEIQDLVADLKAEGVTAQLGPGAEAVSGDPVLLRLALRVLVDQARNAGTEALQIRAVAAGGQVRISLDEKAPPEAGASASGRASDEALPLVRKIAELHGGSLTLETNGSSGTRYTLNLTPA